MNILMWHVHGSWTTAFVAGGHRVTLPVLPGRGPDGRGRARTWDWPESVTEVPPERLGEQRYDVVLLQRPHEAALVRAWLGLDPGRDVPAVYVEHNAPNGPAAGTRHPLAGRAGTTVVHVTWFNALMWDCGSAPTAVIEHGVVDPGARWTGELARCGVVVNEPIRRGRVVGTDLLPGLARAAPLDVFGMGVADLPAYLGLDGRCAAHEDLPQDRMHAELARRAVYAHTPRWTSLGLSLLEAMHLGMPVVVVAGTEAARAVPPEAGVVSASPAELRDGVARFARDRGAAEAAGRAARAAALGRYGLDRFLGDWDHLLKEVVS